MSETTENRKRSLPLLLGQGLLGLGLVLGLTWSLAGSAGFSARAWKEGEVAPYTLYAPFSFSFQDLDRRTQIDRGERLIGQGEKLTAGHLMRLQALSRMQNSTGKRLHWLGALLLAVLFAGLGALYLRRYEPGIWQTLPHLSLVVMLILLVLGLAQLILQAPLNNAWIPVATVAMMLGMLLSARVGIVLGLLTAILVGLISRADLPLTAGFGVACFAGGTLVQGIRRRLHFFRAGLIIGIAQGATILGGYLISQWPMEAVLDSSLAGVGSGFLSSLITFCLLPLCESLFGLITDVTLIELSDLNHPLLKELSVRAPGTYHHSLIVASLAEAAGESVGANALLARVGCYFHDIGKMLHPEYFVENQPLDASRHDPLSPSMSSLVILSHVKDGVKLAHRHRLNQAIIDFIPGHHGTGLIYYFYRRALEEVEDERLLKEERFRYPGPKPRAKETAIALLADSSEAATRALREKTPARIQEVVRRIINNKFIDGQLDECDLTLRDLDRIAEAFLRVLAGIYHRRIEYPKAPWEEDGGAQAVTG